ncbi:MAG: TonB-dependent receptor plug domain-containing protein [Opitutus sp.]
MFVFLVQGLPSAEGANSTATRFDVPAGDAAEMLKRFSAQARREILFPADAVIGVKTNAIKGALTVRDALDRMVARTGLTVAEDSQTGALMIFRAAQPKTPGVAPPEQRKPPPTPQRSTPTPTMTRKIPLTLLSALLAVFSPAADAAAAETDPQKEEPIVLSEFRVDASNDRGYTATNATTGTRLNMAIKNIPMPVEVITRQFIDDIGAFDVKEALQYSAGIVQDTVQSGNNFFFSPSGTGQATGALSRDSATLNIRGINVRSYLRNGFRQDTVTDIINVDRMEVVRGPQALLYGVATLGGVVNIGPKYPRSRPRTTAQVAYGSYDFYRAEIYKTGPVYKSANGKRELNYGIGFVYQNIGGAADYDIRKRILVTPSLEFRPFENTSIFIDVEYGKFKNTGIGFMDVNDAAVIQNGRNEFGLRVNDNINPYGETEGVTRRRFGKDRFYRLSGADSFKNDDYFSGTIEITQKILPQLTLVMGANYTDRLTDSRIFESNSTSVSTTSLLAAAGAPTSVGVWTSTGTDPRTPANTLWKTIGYQWVTPRKHVTTRQSRVDLNYGFTLFGNKQNIVLGRQDQTIYTTDTSKAQVTGNVAGATNRSYIPYDPSARLTYQGELNRIFQVNPFTEWNSGHYAVYQGHWFKDKLTTIAGMRLDRYMVRTWNNTYVKADPTLADSVVTNWVKPAAPDAASYNSTVGGVPTINGYKFGGKTQHEQSPMIGVSYALTDDLSIYGLTATGVFPNTGQRTGDGTPFDAEKSKSKEVGLKFDIWKDSRGRSRVSGSIGVYRLDRKNAIYNLFWAPQPRSFASILRAGYTGNTVATGAGTGAYTVVNSGYTNFQPNNPVTYLVPLIYVAASDLSNPRVTGAPQTNGFILVDYASLSTAANDPLRRALDTAIADPSNLTALQQGSTGSGAAQLNANNGYSNRNSDTAYNDRNEGIDLQFYFNITDNFSSVLTYNYIKQGVDGGFRVVDMPKSTEYDSWWNYMGIPLEDRRKDLNEGNYDFSGQIKGIRTIDNPRNQLSLWNKYEFNDGVLKGLNLGLGINYNGPRQSENIINNGARDTRLVPNVRFRPNFSADYKLNIGIGYRARIADRSWNFRLNVNNILNEQKKTAYGESMLYIDPTTGAVIAPTVAGAQQIKVPERAIRYYEPISFRLSASTAF